MIHNFKYKFPKFGKEFSFFRTFSAILIFIIGLQASSCVYFNTFYNAEKYYDIAEKENQHLDENTPVRAQNYQKSLDTAAKIPEFYPDSKYVDDALALMGKCYYKMEQYPKAQRKFEELISNYPESDFIDEANLYLGLSLTANNSFERARDVLTGLSNVGKDKDLKERAKFALGDLLIREEKYSQAADLFNKLSESANKKKNKGEAGIKEGNCNLERKDYEAAAVAFQKAAKNRKLSLEQRFGAYYNWAVSLKISGDFSGAQKVLHEILKEQKFFNYFAQANLELAEISHALGESDEAFTELEKITVNNTKTEESARAFYIMGLITRDQRRDYEKAEEYFNKVSTEKNDSPYADSARTALDLLTYWRGVTAAIDSVDSLILKDENLLAGIVDTVSAVKDTSYSQVRKLFDKGGDNQKKKDNIKVDEKFVDPKLNPDARIEHPGEIRPDYPEGLNPEMPPGRLPPNYPQNMLPPGMTRDSLLSMLPDSLKDAILDSLFSAPDTSSGIVDSSVSVVDSSISEPAVLDTAEVLGRIVNNRLELERLQYQLAEVLYFQLGNKDSSLTILSSLADSSKAGLSAKSLFLTAHIFKQSGDSSRVDSVYRKIVEEHVETEFARAAKKWLGMEIEEDTQVDSAKILFREAETAYFNQGEIEEALKIYAQVDSLYPESPFAPKALFARAKIQEIELFDYTAAINLLTKLKEKYPKDTLASIASKRVTITAVAGVEDTSLTSGLEEPLEGEDIIYYPDEIDQPATCTKDSAAIAQYIRDNNLYPSAALASGIKGKVVLAIVVDKYGYPGDMEIVSEEPPNWRFGEAALGAAENFEYTAGMRRNKPVAVEIEVLFTFEP